MGGHWGGGKGDRRAPQYISDKQMEENWNKAFKKGEPKMIKQYCDLSGKELDEYYTISFTAHSTRHPEKEGKPAKKSIDISPWEMEELKKYLDEREVIAEENKSAK